MFLWFLLFGVVISKDFLLNKQPIVKHPSSSCVPSNDNDGNTIYIGNCNYGEFYSINANLGTPPQSVDLIFTTQSNYSWVQITQLNSQAFNASDSLSFILLNSQYEYELYYMGGTVIGLDGTDIFSIPNTNIFNTMQFYFIDQLNFTQTFPNQIDGILGMGYSKFDNFLDIAWKKGQIKSNNFTLSLKNANKQSYLFYDDIPEQIIVNSFFAPVYNQSYWSVQSLYFTTDSLDLSKQAANLVIFDSSLNPSCVNQQLWTAIYNYYLDPVCKFDKANGQVYCPCPTQLGGKTKYPTFAITVGNHEIYLSPQSYFSFSNQTLGVCFFNFYLCGDDTITLGTQLFAQYNVTFSKEPSIIGLQGNLTPNLKIDRYNFFPICQQALFGILGLMVIYGLILLILNRCCYRSSADDAEQAINSHKRKAQLQQITQPENQIKEENNFAFVIENNEQTQIESPKK